MSFRYFWIHLKLSFSILCKEIQGLGDQKRAIVNLYLYTQQLISTARLPTLL